jgi:hypothetical protein
MFYSFYAHSYSREKRLSASSCRSVDLPVRTYQRGSQWTDFCEILFWQLSWKSVQKLQTWLKSEQKYWALYMKT